MSDDVPFANVMIHDFVTILPSKLEQMIGLASKLEQLATHKLNEPYKKKDIQRINELLQSLGKQAELIQTYVGTIQDEINTL